MIPPLTGITDVQYIAEALSSEGFTRSDIWESLQSPYSVRTFDRGMATLLSIG